MNDRQTNQPYKPTGFCVRCLYPGTPGDVCSECGGRMVSRGSKEGRLRTGVMSWRKWTWVWLAISVAHVGLSRLAIEAIFVGFMQFRQRSLQQRLANAFGNVMFQILHPWILLPCEIPDSIEPRDEFGAWLILVAWAIIYSASLLFLFGCIRAWRIRRRIRQVDRGAVK